MRNKLKLYAAASGVAIAVLGATPAFAVGTDAGSSITNTATINFNVGTVAQTAVTATNTFVVDRKVNLTVVELGTATTTVVPGQTQAATTFTVTNTSNATIDVGLSAANLAGGAAPHGGTDVFDPGAYTLYLDDGDNVFDAGDTLITYLDEVAEDGVRVVHVVTSISAAQTNGQIAAVSLTGTAEAAGTAGTEGAALTATGGADTAAMDTVLADAAGSDDAITDGKHSARDDYTVSAPVLTVSKLSRVISDPINGVSANAKAIPGAVVEYCIVVANAGGGAAADSVIITDSLPTQTSYLAAFGVKTGGTVVTGSTCTPGAGSGSFADPVVTGNLGTVGAGTQQTVVFQVTIL